jgi:guanosine-3',5'-bis(diphosphate) 3'-pyrophosphohydrolase
MANRKHDSTFATLIEAAMFAAEKHRKCRRKDVEATPYINHPIKVASLLAGVGKIDDVEMLQAALLHDTVEDTPTKPEEIEERFGRAVRDLVMEVTDDKDVEKLKRKRIQVEKAPNLTPRAKMIKIADKIANLSDMAVSPPVGWPHERLTGYVDWSNAVVAGCLGHNEPLDVLYDEVTEQVAGVLKRAS